MLMLSTQRAERANVPSCRGTCHIDTSVYTPMSKHSTPSSSIRVSARRKEEEEEKGGGGGEGSNAGLNPSGRVSWQGHVSLSRRTAGVRCAHTRHSVKLYANAGRVAGSPAARNNRRRHAFRSTNAAAATAERLYARFMKLCKVHGAQRGNSAPPRRRVRVLRPTSRGARTTRTIGTCVAPAFAAEMQMVTFLSLVGLN